MTRAVAIRRDSPVNFPLKRRLDLSLGNFKNIVLRDVARANFLRGRAQSLVGGSLSDIKLIRDEVHNEQAMNAFNFYTTKIGVGTPPTTWKEYLDTVALSSDLVLVNQSIGAASSSQGLDIDGILGIGPKDLTQGTLNPAKNDIIPTVTDTAFAQGHIGQNEIGVYFEPITSPSQGTGQLSYGDYHHIPGVVDTGSTLVLIATDAFNKYREAVGAVLDQDTGLLRINATQFGQLQNLVFQISGSNFELTPNAQLWPRSLNTAIGGSKDCLYLIVADIGIPSGSGLDFINGYTFLERFYTSFDTTNKRVGFARTHYTDLLLN
ncbi:hypothetical protein C0995_010253 [Termitomyces sp. Mi166|nr:hypothetical protein C0995_010253 [Termitomyces sp. Mi166\